jgi:two-component system heavy metal sensor histidine kinase CusS
VRSLRSALVARTILGTSIVFVAVAVTLYALLRASLVADFDNSLREKARLIAAVVSERPSGITMDFEDLDIREFRTAQGSGYLQLWRMDGSMLFRSASLGNAGLRRIVTDEGAPVYRWVTLPGGRRGRAIGMKFTAQEEDASHANAPQICMVLARRITPITRSLTRLATFLISVGFVGIAILAVVLWVGIDRSLRPLDRIASRIGGLDETDLSARVEAEGAPSELQPVVARINELLARLEAAFERERSFSADVAHELRTPMAGLRSTLEVVLARDRPANEYREALEVSLEITTQVHRMVETLLSLARLEAGQIEPRSETVVLSEVLHAAWRPLADRAERRRLRVQWELAGPSAVGADRSLLNLVLSNILDNAVAYADEGGWVRIETALRDGSLVVTVSNSGSMLAPGQTEYVFDRFWRGDQARGEAGIHCGLGLSLVKKTAALLGGTVCAESSDDGVFTITVSIREAG